MKKEYGLIALVGLIIGALAVFLMKSGNPPNMGFCIACFQRDIAGALGLHQAKAVQYLRPEIIGIAFGALIAALAFKEFKPSSGSAPAIRFMIGAFSMIGALVFLGCPLRMTIRLGAGDMNAFVGLLGFLTGIWGGTMFLKKDFDLGQTKRSRGIEAWILPGFMLLLLLLLLIKPVFNIDAGGPIFFTKAEPGVVPIPPGAAVAPVFLSLAAGLLVGFLSQRSRFCTIGGFRDLILFKEPYLFIGWVSLLVAVFVGYLLIGKFSFGFEKQPIAHTMHLWNFLGLTLVGINGVLVGGCPLRQLVMAGQGNGDSALYVFGMVVGAAFAHNFLLVANPKLIPAVSNFGQVAVIIGLIFAVAVGISGMMKEKAV